MTPPSMIRTAYHIGEARSALAVAVSHLIAAEAADVDPEVAGPLYAELRTNLRIADKWCEGRIIAGQPDIDRERAAIDEGRDS